MIGFQSVTFFRPFALLLDIIQSRDPGLDDLKTLKNS